MPTIVVRYRPRPEQADTNAALVEDVYAELAQARPADFSYRTIRLADGAFVHIADVGTGGNPLEGLASFAAFLDGIGERCEPGEGPDAQTATVVGSYASDVSSGAGAEGQSRVS